MMMSAENKDSKFNNPRRLEPNDETVTYLTQLDTQLSEQGLDESDTEAVEALVDNVLSEIKTRCASLASDRRTSLIVEKIILKCNLAQVLDVCQRISPYSIFLARNRYSSHVMQSLLSRLCHLLKSYDFDNINTDISDNNENSSIITMEQISETVLELLRPIGLEIVWLSKDVSASHVLRSALCLLVGIPVISERKGKNSKHQHSVSHSMLLEAVLTPGMFHIDAQHTFAVPSGFHGK
jgi:hypothetical protein